MIKLYPFENVDKKIWEFQNVFHLIHKNLDIGDKSILAIGAGNEPVSYWCYITGYKKVVHTDLNETYLEKFKERFLAPNNLLNKISVRNLDMITFDGMKEDELFDCIYSISSIEHFTTDKIGRCLENSAKHLKSNGLLIFTADVLYLFPEEREENNYLDLNKIRFILKKCKELGLNLQEDFNFDEDDVLINYAKQNLHKQEKIGYPIQNKNNRNLLLPPILFLFRKS